jgi:diguanylate cyclase (GGDEF)-like protein
MENKRRSWLCPTELDRMRVVEASDRVRRARIFIWLAVGVAIVLCAPWSGWATLLLFVPAGINLVLLEVMLGRSEHPERWALGSMVFLMLLFAAAIPLTGGADGSAVPLVIIPAAVAPMRFRGVVVLTLGILTVMALLGVCFAFDTRGTLDDPRLLVTTIALLISVTVANWSLVEAEMKQRDAAVLDPLTGLLNRKALEARALELEQQARLTGGSIALIACDLDNFKNVNDSHGHDRGDAVLRSFAYQVRKALRSFELIYRLGGEEFLIVLPAAGHEESLLVAERLRKTIEESRPGGLPVTCSFGVSAGAGDEVVYSRLFKAADEALYRAKAGGRNRVCGDEEIAASMPELAPQPVPVA